MKAIQHLIAACDFKFAVSSKRRKWNLVSKYNPAKAQAIDMDRKIPLVKVKIGNVECIDSLAR